MSLDTIEVKVQTHRFDEAGGRPGKVPETAKLLGVPRRLLREGPSTTVIALAPDVAEHVAPGDCVVVSLPDGTPASSAPLRIDGYRPAYARDPDDDSTYIACQQAWDRRGIAHDLADQARDHPETRQRLERQASARQQARAEALLFDRFELAREILNPAILARTPEERGEVIDRLSRHMRSGPLFDALRDLIDAGTAEAVA